jgi:(p)ppGpp synthase/HD superfamily hydrolase
MGARVLAAAARAGVARAALPALERAHALAMEPRVRALDERAHDLLHPGRSALILLVDTGERSARALAAAMLVESERDELSVPMTRVVAALGGEVGERVADVPTPGQEDLLERLVTASPEVQRIALAERLDQLRHAHLWPDPERRRRAHEQALSVYAPVAERAHPTLARRYAWWCGMFARKYLAGLWGLDHC